MLAISVSSSADKEACETIARLCEQADDKVDAVLLDVSHCRAMASTGENLAAFTAG
jgi:hypothetical protein